MLEKFGSRIIEITFVILVLTLVVQNAAGFGSVAASISNVYNSGVRTLQGR